MTNTTEADKIYIAGFFDGEGCVGYYNAAKSNPRRPGYFCCHVHVCNIDPRVIRWIHQITCMGRVNVMKGSGKRRTAYQWQVSKRSNVIAFLSAIIPYLKVKREQAEILLTHLMLESSYVKSHGSVTSEIVESRQQIVDKLKELKWMDSVEGVETRRTETVIH